MAGIWGGLFFLIFLTTIMIVIRWSIEMDSVTKPNPKRMSFFSLLIRELFAMRDRVPPPKKNKYRARREAELGIVPADENLRSLHQP